MTTETAITISSSASAMTAITAAGMVADQIASAGVFDDYRARKAQNTLRRQVGDLDLFARYLAAVHVQTTGAALQSDPMSWHGMTWGIVEGFKRWMLLEGYAVSSVNIRLSTIRTYAKLAHKAGVLETEQYMKIAHVDGYSHGEAANLDAQRDTTRIGSKKSDPVELSKAQVKALKENHPDTPQGRRDRVIMTLLLDHGLRCGELADLTVGAFDLTAGTFTFYREKVKFEQTHKLTPAALRAVRDYINAGDAPMIADHKLLRASAKGGKLLDNRWMRDPQTGKAGWVGMTRRAITKRVETLGRAIAGVEGLSAHDGRHTWATLAARNGTQMDRLQDAGGWSSIAMPARYIERAKIANQGVNLGED